MAYQQQLGYKSARHSYKYHTLNGWKRVKSPNPYESHVWINEKKKLMMVVHYDIGFDKQRNATVYDLSDHRLSGFHDLKTHYGTDEKDALKFAKSYMENN
jgi:hypothetical protein